MFLTDQPASADYLAMIGKTFGVLALVAALAWVLVRFVAPRLNPAGRSSRIKVLERLRLEPRRSIYLVRVDDDDLVLGVSEASIELIDRRPSTDGAPEPPR